MKGGVFCAQPCKWLARFLVITASMVMLSMTTIGVGVSRGKIIDNSTYYNSEKISVSEDNATVTGLYGIENSSTVTMEKFVNQESGSVNVNAEYEDSATSIYGTSLNYGDNNGYFSNVGNILVSVKNLPNTENNYYNNIYGNRIYGLNSMKFSNSGTISVSAEAGSAVGDNSSVDSENLYGNHITSSGPIDFSNSGTISVLSKVGNAEGDNSSVNSGNIYGNYISSSNSIHFTNSGTIYVSSKLGDVAGGSSYVNSGSVYGNYFHTTTSSTNIINYGKIYVSVEMGNALNNTSAMSSGEVYGNYIDNATNTFSNSGTISVSEKIGEYSGLLFNGLSGNDFESSVGIFSNSGTISASSELGNAVENNSPEDTGNIYGNYFSDNVTVFSNSGTISASAKLGDIKGDNSSVYSESIYGNNFLKGSVGGFSNSGTISASSEAGNAIGDNSSVYQQDLYGNNFGGPVKTFSNSGTTSVSARAGSAEGDNSGVYLGYSSGLYGNRFSDNVTAFSNSGTISVSAEAGDAVGDSSKVILEHFYGNDFEGPVDSFSSSGTISVSAEAGDAVGDSSKVYISGIDGVSLESTGSYVNNASNSGTISVSARAGSAEGDNSGVYLSSIYGINFSSPVNNTFSNSGTVSISAEAGDAVGDNSTVHLSSIYGINLGYPGGSLSNSGTINININTGKGAEIYEIYGITSSTTTITNTGTIRISAYGGEGTTLSDTAGIKLDGVTAQLSSTGGIYLSTNIPNADMREIWITGGSDVTLNKNLTVVLGNPGVTERPIYVDSSTLNLNGANLIVLANTDLKFNTPYYLIDDNGTVEGKFGNLINGIKNPDIVPYWYNKDRDENAAIGFTYKPKKATAGASTCASLSEAKALMDSIPMGSSYGVIPMTLGENGIRNILLADSGQIKSDAYPEITTTDPRGFKNTVLLYPFYFRVDADNLNYNATGGGFMLEFRRTIDPSVEAGIFAGMAQTKITYTNLPNSDDSQHMYPLGFYVKYTPHPYSVRLLAMGYAVHHKYNGYTGTSFTIPESASYTSYGFEGEATGGYTIGNAHAGITPEIGLGLSYYTQPSYHTNAKLSQWDKYYESTTVNQGRVIAGVSGYDILNPNQGSTKITLSGSVKLEEIVGSNTISVTQSIPGLGSGKKSVDEDVSRSSILTSLGLSSQSGRVKFGVLFDSRLNADYKAYGFRVSCGIAF